MMHTAPPLPAATVELATSHLRDILATVVDHPPGTAHAALGVADAHTSLAGALTEAYRRNLPHAPFIGPGGWECRRGRTPVELLRIKNGSNHCGDDGDS